MTLNVGDHGYDSSGTILSPAEILDAGGKFVFRYLSGSPGGWKDWSAPEIAAYEAAGLIVGAYWETGATRTLDGFQAGVDDANAAVAEEGRLGHVFDFIAFADDENNDGSDGAKMAYYDGVASVLPLRFEVYGSGGLIDAVAGRHGRTHGGHVSSWGSTGNAGFRQEANYHTLPGTDDLTLLKADTFSGGGGGNDLTAEEHKWLLDMTSTVFILQNEMVNTINPQLAELKAALATIAAKVGA